MDAPILDRRDDPFATVELSKGEAAATVRALNEAYRENMDHAAKNPCGARSVFLAHLYQLKQLVHVYAGAELPLDPGGIDVLHDVIGTMHSHTDAGPGLESAWEEIHAEWRSAHGHVVPDDADVQCRECGHELVNGGVTVSWEQPHLDVTPQPDARCVACDGRVDPDREHFDTILAETRERR